MTAKRNGATKAPPDWMTAAEASEYLGVSISTLAHWRVERRGPRWHRYGAQSRNALVRYLRPDLDTFIAASAMGGDTPAPESGA